MPGQVPDVIETSRGPTHLALRWRSTVNNGEALQFYQVHCTATLNQGGLGTSEFDQARSRCVPATECPQPRPSLPRDELLLHLRLTV